MSSIRTCPQCNMSVQQKLTDPSVIVCEHCHSIVYENVVGYKKPGVTRVPFDWSFVQIGTTFNIDKEVYTVVGRVRLQLLHDYKNFWCAAGTNSKYYWIMESFASFSVLDPSWHHFNASVDNLKADTPVMLGPKMRLKGEYVEKCEHVSYEGEIGEWKLFEPGFFFSQSSNMSGVTAVFLVNGHHDIQYLQGVKSEFEKLQLQNIVQWDEWK